MTDNCTELRLDDLVRIDLLMADECTIPIPPTVTLHSLTASTLTLPTPVLSAAYTINSDDEAKLTDTPELKVSNARQASGNVYTHELTLPLLLERRKAEKAVDTLLGTDFHVLLTRADGSQDLSYCVPNGATLDLDETTSSNSSVKLTAKLLSMSHLIRLV